MSELRIRNWDRWQSYRSDRGQPPWIKVHRGLMRDPNWVSLTDAQRGQLVAIWMLAADRDGVIPASAELVRKLCFMDSEPDLTIFAERGFIECGQPDANMTPSRRQHDVPEKKREEKNRKEETELRSVDEIVSCETSQPSPIESPKELPRKYEFECGEIRLNKTTFDDWTKAFSHLDLRAELTALGPSDWVAGLAGKWFVPVSSLLAKRNREAKLKSEQGGKFVWRSGIEGVI